MRRPGLLLLAISRVGAANSANQPANRSVARR